MNDQILLDPDFGLPTANEIGLMKRASDVLLRHYPGYMWVTQATQGLLRIFCGNFSMEWGYVLRPWNDLISDKEIVMAGGELLERFGVRRGTKSSDEIALKNRNFQGLILPDVSDKN